MLVLTRKKNETIFIGEDIRIVLIDLEPKQARIGIACPDALSVMRAELGPRTKKGKWPNLTPDEVAFLLERVVDLAEYWTFPCPIQRKEELHNLLEIIGQIKSWVFDEWLERYSHWYKKD